MNHTTPFPQPRYLVSLGAVVAFAVAGAALSVGSTTQRVTSAPTEAPDGVTSEVGGDAVTYDALMAVLERAGRVEARPVEGRDWEAMAQTGRSAPTGRAAADGSPSPGATR
jgi:hypothetical protein